MSLHKHHPFCADSGLVHACNDARPLSHICAGFQWKKASEMEHPVKKKKQEVSIEQAIDDTAAAIAAAGGGCSTVQEET